MASTNKNNKSPRTGTASKASPHANQRTIARLNAVQGLYQMEVGGADLSDIRTQFAARLAGGELEGETYLPGDADFFNQILAGVLKHQLSIDPMIDATLTGDWPIARIDTTLRAILRAGAFELMYRSDIPAGVVVSEYVDVAKAYFEAEVPAMVNAVLDKIAKSRGGLQDKS
ncbi:MAG TPA: transcription antitermination factor NusB [Devosia sp.]|nr:transcription antitermination factor NusB [Devosia sp.]